MPSDLPGAVLSCHAQIDKLRDALDRISDASQLPYTPLESNALQRSVNAVEKGLYLAHELLDLELKRWGL